MIPIETMEAKIIEALEAITTLKKVDSYQGNIDEIVKKGSIIPLPAALTVYGGSSIENAAARDGARGKVKVQFSVFVIGKNLRGKKEASADVRAILNAVTGGTVSGGSASHDYGFNPSVSGGGIVGGTVDAVRSLVKAMTGGGIAGGKAGYDTGPDSYEYSMQGGGISGGAATVLQEGVEGIVGFRRIFILDTAIREFLKDTLRRILNVY